jgi:hypothetical protein
MIAAMLPPGTELQELLPGKFDTIMGVLYRNKDSGRVRPAAAGGLHAMATNPKAHSACSLEREQELERVHFCLQLLS